MKYINYLLETKKTVDQLLKEPIFTKNKKLTSDLQNYFNFINKLETSQGAKSYFSSIFNVLDFDSVSEGENVENVANRFKNIINSRKYEFSGINNNQSQLLNKFINNNFFNISDDLHSFQLPEDSGRLSTNITPDNIQTLMVLLYQIKEAIKKTTKSGNKNVSSRLDRHVIIIASNLLKKFYKTTELQSVKNCLDSLDILSSNLENIEVESIPLSNNKKDFIKTIKSKEGDGRLMVSSIIKGYIKSNFKLDKEKPIKRETPLTLENIKDEVYNSNKELELSPEESINKVKSENKYRDTFNILLDQLISIKNYPFGSVEARELEDEWINKFSNANSNEEREKQVVNELTNIIHSTNNPTTEHEIKPTVTDLPKDEPIDEPINQSSDRIPSIDELGGVVDEPDNIVNPIKSNSIKCKSDYTYNYNGVTAKFDSGKTYSLLGTNEVPKKDGIGNVLFYNIVAENGRQIKVPSWEVTKYFIAPSNLDVQNNSKLKDENTSNKDLVDNPKLTGEKIKTDLNKERLSAEEDYKNNELEKTLSGLDRFIGHDDDLNPHVVQEFIWKQVKNKSKGFTSMYDGTPFVNNQLTLSSFCTRIINQSNITKSEKNLFKELSKKYTLTCDGSIVSIDYFKKHANELKPITASNEWAKHSKIDSNESYLQKLSRWKKKFLGESNELTLANSEYSQMKLILESKIYIKELKMKSLKESLDSLNKFNLKFNKLF